MKFSKAIVINPPSPPGYVSNKDSMGGYGQLFPKGATLFPPLDLVYLASYLADKNVSTEILECLALELDREHLIENINSMCGPKSGENFLAIIRTSAPTLDWDLSLAGEIRKMTRAHVGIYGPVVPHVLSRIQMERSVNYIFRGEPDETVYEMMEGRSLNEISGLSFYTSKEWIENPDRLPLKDLDSLPFPKWEMLPYEKYKLPKSSTRSDSPFLPMLTSRGCPIGCHYCPYPVGQGLEWRFRSPGNVVDEIEHLVRDLDIRYIIFRDPMFSLNQRRVIKICEDIVDRGLDFEWRCETRVDFLNEDTLNAMAGAGCGGINFGIESSNPEIQTNVGRRPIMEGQFVKTISLCHRLGIKTFAFFIIGLPGDTVETILGSIKFAIDIKSNWVQFTAASPFIGTKLRDWAVSKRLVLEDTYSYINSHTTMIGNENLSREQVQSLLNFAQFFQNYLINRKGVLKDDSRPGKLYRALKSIADSASNTAAQAAFALGKNYFIRAS